jgi:zinc and cadmium transporter
MMVREKSYTNLLAGAYLLFPERIRQYIIPCLISYATGTLLGAAFLGLLRHALENAPIAPILSIVLVGILAFFLPEKLVIWRHCHDAECETHTSAGPLLQIGDAFHNFIDGIAIAAAFITFASFFPSWSKYSLGRARIR